MYARGSGEAARRASPVSRHQSRAWPFACLAFCSTDYRKKRDCSQSSFPPLMDTGSSKALFALCQMLFVLQKNLSTCNKKPYILVWTIFSLTNRQNFKEAVQNVWRATIFGQATKSLVSWQAQPILRRVILFREHYPEKPLWGGNNKVCMYQSSFKWRFLLYEKFHVSLNFFC